MSRGRAGAIQKKTCHVTLTLSELSNSTKSVLMPSLKDEKNLLSKEEKKEGKRVSRTKKSEFNFSRDKERKGSDKANLKKVFRRKAI